MAGYGPVPKRSEERIRRNKVEGLEKLDVIGKVEVPPLGIPDCNEFVQDLYDSLAESAQSKYYEPSDWQIARVLMYKLHEHFKFGTGAVVFATIMSELGELLVTEGSRRRVRLEVERAQSEAKVIDAGDMFRQIMSQAK